MMRNLKQDELMANISFTTRLPTDMENNSFYIPVNSRFDSRPVTLTQSNTTQFLSAG